MAVGLAICCCLSAVNGQPFPSFLLDTIPRVGPAVEEATQPVIAFADSVGLLIWRDYSAGHIRGCRLTRDLVVLDSVMLDITGGVNNGESYHRFDVAASDHNFLVTWLDGGWYDVEGAIVSLDGTVSKRFTIDDDPELHDGTAVDFDGENFLVAWWQQDAVWFCTRYARVTTSGMVLDDPPWQLPGDGYEAGVDVGFGDSLHLMTYGSGGASDTEGVYCRLARRDGSLVGDDPVLLCAGTTWTEAYVEFNGEVFTVTLSRILGDSCEVRVYPVSLDGVVLDTAGVLVERDDCVRECALAWYGDTGLVAWRPGHDIDTISDIYARRLDRSFHVLDTARLKVTTTYYGQRIQGPSGPAVAGSNGGFAVAYSYLQSHGHRDMVYRRVSPGGQVLDTADRLASFAASRASFVHTATDGRDFLAVWQEVFPDSLSSGIYAARFSSDGEILQPRSIRLSPARCAQPDIAFADSVYLVLWHNDADTSSIDLQVVRVGRDGVPLDTVPISIPDDRAYTAAVAGSPDAFLVVWQHRSDSICGVRIAPDGTLLDTTRLYLARSISVREAPVVASDGDSTFLVVFHGRSGTSDGVAALRVGASGATLDTGAIILDGYSDYSAPDVAFGAGRFMVVDPGSGKGWFITPDGARVDTIAGYLGWWSPQVIFDSVNFLVYEATSLDTLTGVRVTPEGAILDPDAVPLVAFNPEESYFVGNMDAAADSLGVVGLAFGAFEPGRFMSSRPRAAVFHRVTVDVDDAKGAKPRLRAMQSIVRRVLYEPDHSQNGHSTLLDVSGRKVLDLHPGVNDVRALAPGVYFVREAQAQAVRKIVVTE